MFKKKQSVCILLANLLILPTLLFSQMPRHRDQPYIPAINRPLLDSEKFEATIIDKSPGTYSREDWADVIDSTWGSGLPTATKLAVFDRAWNEIDMRYGAFQNLEVDLDSLKSLYRPEIEKGVSRGRFAAIMTRLSFALLDAHTSIFDSQVSFGTSIRHGIPLFVVGGDRDNARFGAVLTPLPDSSLLVLKVLPNHVLGLKPGDVVLGYDGVPWKKLYKQILAAQLPISLFSSWGSTIQARTHIMLRSAGLNWHLFDTIDILKYDSGDTLHFSTSLLVNQRGTIWGNEQLDVSGVQWPNIFSNDFVSWGIVEGTKVGYIYVTSWSPSTQLQISNQFHNAIDSLMHHNETTGMIVDFRLNYGGWMPVAHAGYSLLFDRFVREVAFDIRGDPGDHFSMVPHPTFTSARFMIPGVSNTFYDKPIAVLTGPGAVSNGDWESLRMKFHPMVRTFGKSTNGAFTSSDNPSLGVQNWFFSKATGNGYLIDGHVYLAHTGVEIDEEVWFDRNDAARGTDTVVEAALQWIENAVVSVDDDVTVPAIYSLQQNYPNPFNPETTIRYNLPQETVLTLKIYNTLGQEIKTLFEGVQQEGLKIMRWDGKNGHGQQMPSGIYFYRLQTDSGVDMVQKMTLLK